MKIGTHNGAFHSDEALAVYMLKQLPQYRDADVVRSRDPAVLEGCDIIVDVTGQYDGTRHFDHHQREFRDTFSPEHSTRLSSAGLVYKHFGKDVLRSILADSAASPTPEDIDLLYRKVYDEFIEPVDANDNGISAYPPDVKPRFKETISIFSLVSSYNPWWNEQVTPEKEMVQFSKGSRLIGDAFADKVRYYGNAWLPARDLVKAAMLDRTKHDPSGRIVVFDRFMPWKQHLFQLEQELDVSTPVLYVLYPDSSSNWRIQAVPEQEESFASRKALPEQWRGLRDEELSKASGIPGCIFIHASGFIGGAATKEAVFALAQKALADE